MLSMKDIDSFTLDIKDGYFYWKCKLAYDDTIYQIKYIYENHITPKGNKSKRKVYYIIKNEEKLIFDDEVKKNFKAFIMPYIRSGI